MDYKLTKYTRRDLEEIRRFTKKVWGSDQSATYLEKLTDSFALIANNPNIGLDRTDDLAPGIRSFVHGSHIIYYISTTSPITVIGILHQNMDPQIYLTER